jgi:hypothetical protein
MHWLMHAKVFDRRFEIQAETASSVRTRADFVVRFCGNAEHPSQSRTQPGKPAITTSKRQG